MSIKQRPSATDFTLMHLREAIRTGRWLGRVPGEREVAAQLKVSKTTVAAAFAQLVAEGMLVKQGPRRRMGLGAEWLNPGPERPQKINLLLNCPLDIEGPAVRALVLRLTEEIEAMGVCCAPTRKTQSMLGHDPERILRAMEEDAADAWIILGGRRDLLEAVAARGMRVFALGGHFVGLPLAAGGHDADAPMMELVARLTELGHSGIVFVAPLALLRPTPVRVAAAFAQALGRAGIPVSAYHLPETDGEVTSFVPLLHELFRVTPPTALILSHAYQVCAAYAFLSERGLRVPRDVSLAVLESDPAFSGMSPALTQVEKDWDGLRRIVLRWVKRLGRTDGVAPPVFAKSRLNPGGTLAVSPRRGDDA